MYPRQGAGSTESPRGRSIDREALNLDWGMWRKRRGYWKSSQRIPKFVEGHITLATAYYRQKRKSDGDRERAIVDKLNPRRNRRSCARNDSCSWRLLLAFTDFSSLMSQAGKSREAQRTEQAISLYRQAVHIAACVVKHGGIWADA